MNSASFDSVSGGWCVVWSGSCRVVTSTQRAVSLWVSFGHISPTCLVSELVSLGTRPAPARQTWLALLGRCSAVAEGYVCRPERGGSKVKGQG